MILRSEAALAARLNLIHFFRQIHFAFRANNKYGDHLWCPDQNRPICQLRNGRLTSTLLCRELGPYTPMAESLPCSVSNHSIVRMVLYFRLLMSRYGSLNRWHAIQLLPTRTLATRYHAALPGLTPDSYGFLIRQYRYARECHGR